MLLVHITSLILGTLNFFTHSSEACSPTGQDDLILEHRAHLFDYVIVGRILKHFPDPRFDYGAGSSAYTALMKVYCSYKGGSQPQLLNITEAGFIEGHCHANQLLENREYIIMAMKPGHDLKILHEIPLSKRNLQDVIMACGLNLQFPTMASLDQDEEDRCLLPAEPESCVENPKVTPSDKGLTDAQNTSPNDSPMDVKPISGSEQEKSNDIKSSEPPQKHKVVCENSSSQRTVYSLFSILLMVIFVRIVS